MNYADIGNLAGADNMGGYQDHILLAPVSWFANIATYDATTGIGDSVTISTAHTFNDPLTQGFVKLYATYKYTKGSTESTGDTDSRGAKISIEFRHPGNKKDIAEFARWAKNDQFIVLLPDAALAPGTYEQVGIKGLPAEIMHKWESGDATSGGKFHTFTIESYANGKTFHTAPVALKP